MTTRDIAEHLKLAYGADVSHETVANITDAINETVKEWRNLFAGMRRGAPAGAPLLWLLGDVPVCLTFCAE